MYGMARVSYMRQLGPLVNDLSNIKILGHITGTYEGEGRYIIEANWKRCRNPAYYEDKTLLYIDPSIDKDEVFINGAYWITEDAIEIIHDFKTNKSAVGLLSKE